MSASSGSSFEPSVTPAQAAGCFRRRVFEYFLATFFQLFVESSFSSGALRLFDLPLSLLTTTRTSRLGCVVNWVAFAAS